MQSSIFDLPINSTIADLPSAIVKPKSENWFVVEQKPTVEPRASPKFAIGEIVRSSNYFKKLNGEIIGFEQYGGVDFTVLRYQWYESIIDYPAIASSLISVLETPLSEISLPVENPQPIVDFLQVAADNPQVKIGDRVKVLRHEFMGDRIGTIQDLHSNGKQAVVNFGDAENIWLITIRSLENV
jgi:hypothetical protein